MDWSGLDNGFLEDNHQPAENLVRKPLTYLNKYKQSHCLVESSWSVSSEIGDTRLLLLPLFKGAIDGRSLWRHRFSLATAQGWIKSNLNTDHSLVGEKGNQELMWVKVFWQYVVPAFYSPLPLPHSAATYRSSLLLKLTDDGSSAFEICPKDHAGHKTDEALPEAGECVGFYLASSVSSPRGNYFEEVDEVSAELPTPRATVTRDSFQARDDLAEARLLLGNVSNCKMSPLPIFNDDSPCNNLPTASEHFHTLRG